MELVEDEDDILQEALRLSILEDQKKREEQQRIMEEKVRLLREEEQARLEAEQEERALEVSYCVSSMNQIILNHYKITSHEVL